MSLPIHVDAYSGYRANERPIRFWLDAQVQDEDELTGVYEIAEVEDRWYDPTTEYFKVRTADGKRCVLRYSTVDDEWTLQSAFDGAALMARPSIEVITVGVEDIRAAGSESPVASDVEGKRLRFLSTGIRADVLGKRGPFEFVMSEPARCPNCRAELTEKTLVEPQAGIEVATHD